MSSRAIIGSRPWILWVPLAVCTTPASPGVQGPQVPVASPAAAAAAIELERTGCFGSCPSFTMALDDDGTVRWNGRGSVGAKGGRTTRVPPFEVHYLFDRFRAVDFSRLQPRYGSDDSDSSMMLLRMRTGDDRRTVEIGPTAGRIDSDGREIEGWQTEEEVIALGDAIESVLGLERWIRINEPIEARTSDYESEAFGLSSEAFAATRIELATESDEHGSPSSYRIILRGDGSVEWEGRTCVREKGERSSTIPVEQVRWLLHRFEEARFFDISDPEFGPARTCCQSSLALRLPGREHAVAFRVPIWPSPGKHPDTTYRTAIDCAALARTIRVLVRADRWIGWGWETLPGHEAKPR